MNIFKNIWDEHTKLFTIFLKKISSKVMQIQLKVKKAKIQRTFELEQCMYVTEKHLLTNRPQQVLRFSTRMFVKIRVVVVVAFLFCRLRRISFGGIFFEAFAVYISIFLEESEPIAKNMNPCSFYWSTKPFYWLSICIISHSECNLDKLAIEFFFWLNFCLHWLDNSLSIETRNL